MTASVQFGGFADLYSWWVKSEGRIVEAHEREHIANARNMFNGYNQSGSAFTGTCFTQAKAECLVELIATKMLHAFQMAYTTSNMEVDCNAYGLDCDKIPNQVAQEEQAWKDYDEASQKCMKNR